MRNFTLSALMLCAAAIVAAPSFASNNNPDQFMIDHINEMIREGYIDDTAVVWLDVDISYIHEYFYNVAVDEHSSTTTSNRDEIGFRFSGEVTFYRWNRQKMAGLPIMYGGFSGTLENPQHLRLSFVNANQTHTCVDDQSFMIGRQTKDLTSSTEIDFGQATGGVELFCEGRCPSDRVRIHLQPWYIETDYIDCDNSDCFIYNFFIIGDFGENPEAGEEDEFGINYDKGAGFDLAVADWSEIKVASNGGVPIQLSLNWVNETDYVDPVTGRERFVDTYTVSGWIRSVDDLPLEPLTED
ncbi:MAG TPA: hypothetical protein ENN67_08160 [Firmicutes bacterium]|nr:hypothetical protein [Bacillota bacterium]